MSTKAVFSSDIYDTKALIQEFFTTFPFLQEEESAFKIQKAWNKLVELSLNLKTACGLPYYIHPLRVSYILAESSFDTDTIVSGFLHGLLDKGLGEDDFKADFGDEVFKIVSGAAKIQKLPSNNRTLLESDAIRKMLFALADDVRVIFVKLADRLDRIRYIKNLEESERKILAQEVIDIWAPLADRLGMQNAKNEFEDLSLKYTNPAAFRQIKEVISQKQEERKAYLEEAVAAIQNEAVKQNIQVEISSRAKHFYSIYQKMRKRNKDPSELYDLLALRIICQKKSDCYNLVGIVHALWSPLEGRFKDYIAMPKSNGYQSLHTTVMCKDRPLEIQIRTKEMHEFAEHGLASHWLYKKGKSRDLVDIGKLGIFNQISQLKDSDLQDGELYKEFKNELLADEIVVFTPKGDVKKLPLGATAIDFAYSIHSAIGEKIVGAKADGKIIPLSMPLKNTQIIEVITNPNAHPTEGQLKIVKTGKAHQKIHSWLYQNDPTFIDHEMQAKIEAENLLRAKENQALQNARRAHKKGEGFDPEKEEGGTTRVKIGNSSNFLITFAKCCQPRFPDPIAGYVSRVRGITVHRADCPTYARIQDLERRRIDVEWDKEQK
ncbi:MAG: RelA/SpoT family protein [Treponema sp.]|nr:RelA/SpoT family protein [Treponema sp.]